ncbi:MAG: Gfo/Idh/MocA family oxidoreductase [Actinomycetota bacterium]|nr:Gfo/Idh/MocA family oxidoreductase [Actinomycetota bacterium]
MIADPRRGPQDTPRVAVVGCGYWGANLVRNFAALGALGAVHDEERGAAELAAASTGAEAKSWDAILTDTTIDAVAISTPPATHAELAVAALEAGKDVFVEKPLALHVGDAEQVTKTAAAADRVLMVGHLLRYHPAFIELESLVRRGALGELRYIYSNRLNFGRFRRVENILWSFAPHDISMILTLVGAEPDVVTAISASYLQQEIADVTTTHLSFQGGQAAHVFVSWLHPFKEQKLVVIGAQAMAVFDDGEPWTSKLRVYEHEVAWREGVPEARKTDGRDIDIPQREPLLQECAHFIDCVVTRTPPLTDGHEGTRVLRVLEAAERSMRSAEQRE